MVYHNVTFSSLINQFLKWKYFFMQYAAVNFKLILNKLKKMVYLIKTSSSDLKPNLYW